MSADCDVAIVGGGLAGGLIALALAQQRPDVRVRLFDAEPAVAHRRWSWFRSDLSREGNALMRGLPIVRWDGGYDVRFPDQLRHVGTRYRSLSSADFATALERVLPTGSVRRDARVTTLEAGGVTLEGGEFVGARAVVDCRTFAPTANLTGGWQVFLGRHVRTEVVHGVERPLIMDASVGQTGDFRFVYLLPVNERELLIEDTYYQTRPVLDREALSRRIDRYIGRKGWSCEVLSEESGVLPVITGGDFTAWQAERRITGVARVGAHAGFLHPLTSYTLPFAVETALAITHAADLAGPELATMLEERAAAHWQATRYYRRLGAMLFGAARPSKRWKIFARFYRLPAPLIERFYAARSTRADRLRILCGKPPISPFRAVRALATSRPALTVAA